MFSEEGIENLIILSAIDQIQGRLNQSSIGGQVWSVIEYAIVECCDSNSLSSLKTLFGIDRNQTLN